MKRKVASVEGVELSKEAEQEQDVTEAALVLEEITKEKKASWDQSKVEFIVQDTEKNKLSDQKKRLLQKRCSNA